MTRHIAQPRTGNGATRDATGCHDSTLRDVLKRAEPAIREIGKEAARNFNGDVDDAMQEARVIAWGKHSAGLPMRLVIQYTRQVMLDPGRSPLRAGSALPRTRGDGVYAERGYRSPATSRQARALLRLTSSAMAAILARVEVQAPMRCPRCGGQGVWGSRRDVPESDGDCAGKCIENEAEAEARWSLYDAPRKARDDQVWWCRRCGGWTWDPTAKAVEVQLSGDTYMHVHDDTVGVDGEALLMRYVESGRRGRLNDLNDDDDGREEAGARSSFAQSR